MTTFDDRERAEEAQFARAEEMAFRVTARAQPPRRHLGGRSHGPHSSRRPTPTPRRSCRPISRNRATRTSVRKLLGDLVGAGVDVDDARVRSALHDAMVEARRQLLEAH